MRAVHRMPFGAEILAPGSARFRLWAPAAHSAALLLEGSGAARELPMAAAGGGWFELETAEAAAGALYRFRVDAAGDVPDPASRFQPRGVHGPSEVVDPAAFAWEDAGWTGRPWEEAVIYELHVGAFTPGGRLADAAGRLEHLADLGATAVELMPLSDCPGDRNWGYDGVLPFAPAARYGRPEDLKAFVQTAHRLGLMVFLDVVYNHFGPEGNHLARYAPAFFTERHRTPWGAAIDFEGPGSRPVRDFFIHNALYWLEEFRIDGLRLDAVHAIHDASEPDFLTELAGAVRERFGTERRVHLVLENDGNEAERLARGRDGGPVAYVAQWNDDIHHALHVILTGEREGYYADYADRPVHHLGRCLTEGFAYQGDASPFRGGAKRGSASAQLPPTAFVSFLQNHDQVGNRAFGERIARLAEPAALEAAAAILLLAPSPPLLFMGEEWGADEPFPFFCDFGPDLAARVREGRRREFAGFPQFRDPEARERIPDPGARETFEAAALHWEALHGPGHRERLALFRRLLALRHREIVPRLAGMSGKSGDFRTVGAAGLVARWRLGDGSRLGLIAQLAPEPLQPAPDPPEGRLLFAIPDHLPRRLEGGELPAWSAAWTLG